jgi:hypothetical protein
VSDLELWLPAPNLHHPVRALASQFLREELRFPVLALRRLACPPDFVLACFVVWIAASPFRLTDRSHLYLGLRALYQRRSLILQLAE